MPEPHDLTVRREPFVHAIKDHAATSHRPPHPRLASRDDRAHAPLR
jgi:hypothetical protein